MATPTPPTVDAKTVRENIARARGYLRRDELVRALATLSEALTTYAHLQVVGTLRFEIEVNLDEALMELSRHTEVQPLFPPTKDGKPFLLRYRRGNESLLCTVMGRIEETLRNAAQEAEQLQKEKLEARKLELIAKGSEFLNVGETSKARSLLHRASEEFGKEPGLILQIAKIFRDAGYFLEAGEMYEYAFEVFPKDGAGYSGAIESYMEIHEYEKVEQVYLRVLQQIGAHPVTLLNIAKFYLAWRKKSRALEFARKALQKDPNFDEAKTMIKELEDGRY